MTPTERRESKTRGDLRWYRLQFNIATVCANLLAAGDLGEPSEASDANASSSPGANVRSRHFQLGAAALLHVYQLIELTDSSVTPPLRKYADEARFPSAVLGAGLVVAELQAQVLPATISGYRRHPVGVVELADHAERYFGHKRAFAGFDELLRRAECILPPAAEHSAEGGPLRALDLAARIASETGHDAKTRYNLACFLSSVGDLRAASSNLQIAVALSPTALAAAAHDPSLEALRYSEYGEWIAKAGDGDDRSRDGDDGNPDDPQSDDSHRFSI